MQTRAYCTQKYENVCIVCRHMHHISRQMHHICNIFALYMNRWQKNLQKYALVCKYTMQQYIQKYAEYMQIYVK